MSPLLELNTNAEFGIASAFIIAAIFLAARHWTTKSGPRNSNDRQEN